MKKHSNSLKYILQRVFTQLFHFRVFTRAHEKKNDVCSVNIFRQPEIWWQVDFYFSKRKLKKTLCISTFLNMTFRRRVQIFLTDFFIHNGKSNKSIFASLNLLYVHKYKIQNVVVFEAKMEKNCNYYFFLEKFSQHPLVYLIWKSSNTLRNSVLRLPLIELFPDFCPL